MNEDNKKTEEFSSENQGLKSKKLVKILGSVTFVILVLGALSVLAYKNKHYFVVAKINGQFITRKKLNDFLIESYGEPALEELITQELVDQKLAEENIQVTEDQLNDKRAEISSQLEQQRGVTLEDYLKLQDISPEEFQKNLRKQVKIEQLFVDDIDISEEEINEFLDTYGEDIPGEDEDEKRAFAVEVLLEQEISTLFQQWVQEKRSEAEVDTYLK